VRDKTAIKIARHHKSRRTASLARSRPRPPFISMSKRRQYTLQEHRDFYKSLVDLCKKEIANDDNWSFTEEDLLFDFDELDILLVYTVQYGNFLRELEEENDDSSMSSNEDDDNLRFRNNNKKRRRVMIDCVPKCLEDYFKSIGCKK
jgi:hypothetical protein